MKKFISIIILIGLICGGNRFAYAGNIFHDVPAPVVMGEALHLEVNSMNNQITLYEPMLFYRMQSEQNFRSMHLKREGLVLYADISTTQFHPGNFQYYFAYQDAAGRVHYLPENDPQDHPFQVQILPSKSAGGKIASNQIPVLLLSPEPNAVIPSDELLIAFSVPLEVEHPENYQYKLYIGGVDVSRLLQRDDHLLSFSPGTIRSGLHNIEFKMYDSNGKIVATKEVSFRITARPSRKKGFNSRTSIFVDNRLQTIANHSQNYYRGGLNFAAGYKKFDFGAQTLVSSEESYSRQPVNKYSLFVRYNFSPRSNIYLRAGDFSRDIDPLSFWGKRVRGLNVGFMTRFFNFDYGYGETYRAVEGKLDSTGKISQYGTYKQKFISFRPQFNFGSHFTWALDLLNARDDIHSIAYGSNPKEKLVMGTAVSLNLDNNRIVFKGSFQASIKNEDAVGKIDFDSLADRYDLTGSDRDAAQKFVNLMDKTGFLTLTQGLSPIPSVGWQAEARFRYFNHSLRALYKGIDPEFTTPGNPYLLRDIKGLFITDNVRMLNNQIFLNLYFKNYHENLSQGDAKTRNTEIGGAISYFPFNTLPSVTLSYGNQSRLNGLAENDISPDSTIFLVEDNRTQRMGLSSSYNFAAGSVKNIATFSVTKFMRDDAVYDANQLEYTLLTLGLRNRFSFPLTTRVSYAQTGNDFGKSTFKRSTKIKKTFFAVDYNFARVIMDGDLKPFFHLTYQKISNSGLIVSDYSRLNYTAGLYLRNTRAGNFSVRFDYIDFGNRYSWHDTILSTRYDVSF